MKTLMRIIGIYLFFIINNNFVIAQEAVEYFTITVVDQNTGRGVPLVELETMSNQRYYTDSNGIIAFYEPCLMNQRVDFSVFSHGYKFNGHGMNDQSIILKTTPGRNALIKLDRINIAERLYRITGQDIYGESTKLGLPIPIKKQGLNGKVLGQDTFIKAVYKGKIYWFWGDTEGPANWNGHVSGATSELPGKGGLDPNIGVDLTYFVDSNGFSKEMCPFPGPGLVWIDWLVTLPDINGKERLYAKFTRIRRDSTPYERGLAVFDDSEQVFKKIKTIDEWLNLSHHVGHGFRVIIDSCEYIYFINQPGIERVKADIKHLSNPLSYEYFSCLAPGTTFDGTATKLDRNTSGNLAFSWKSDTDVLDHRKERDLANHGLISKDEGLWQLTDIESGKSVSIDPASVFWNNFRKRWVMIAYEFVGGVWYLEGDTPTGPWVYGRKIVYHENYDFYNIAQHPLFDEENGRLIYFEGTYTTGFSGNTNTTPLYDYNQMMYRLDLDNPQLNLPVPIYYIKNVEGFHNYLMRDEIDSLKIWEKIAEIPFFAIPPNRKFDGLVPIVLDKNKGKISAKSKSQNIFKESEKLLFYGFPSVVNNEELISGIWECETDGFNFTMDIELDEDKVKGIINNELIEITEGTFLDENLVLKVKSKNDQVTYVLNAKIKNGMLDGKFVGIENNVTGLLKGKRIDFFWKQFSSPAVIPLYEYQNQDGIFHYSPDSILLGMKKSAKPICRIWRNPGSTLALDFEAKPILINR